MTSFPLLAPHKWRPLGAAWTIALLSSLAVLFVGEVMGQAPCDLCWFQRAFMFPLAIILGIASPRSSRTAPSFLTGWRWPREAASSPSIIACSMPASFRPRSSPAPAVPPARARAWRSEACRCPSCRSPLSRSSLSSCSTSKGD